MWIDDAKACIQLFNIECIEEYIEDSSLHIYAFNAGIAMIADVKDYSLRERQFNYDLNIKTK